MKSIFFLLEKMPNPADQSEFTKKLSLEGVSVFFIAMNCDSFSLASLDDDALLVTDSRKAYDECRAMGIEVLIYIHEEKELDNYPGGKYFVMNPEETEAEYFDRVYRRIHELPWEIMQTKRMIVRETTEDDIDEFVKMYKDPRMTKYMEPLYQDIENEKKYIREYRERVYACQGFGIWTLLDKETKKCIGRAGLTYRCGFDNVEIGFAIGTDYWNQGYATEAISAILSFAKEEELGPVNALIMHENLASIHVVEKFGFTYRCDANSNGLDFRVYCCDEY